MDTHYKTPQDVATHLDVSPSTLRRWSDEFAEFLSDGANSSPGKTHRRYTEQDIDRLSTVKAFMSEGLTYEQVRQQLRDQQDVSTNMALISNQEAASVIMHYISETVENLHQGQVSVLNSQAANRELMGVVIQDNFNLKEENNRLRTRMLELERQIGELRREATMHREAMRQEIEMKWTELYEAVDRTQQVTVLQSRSGCLGSLFGEGQAQISPPPDPYAPYAPPSSQTAPPRSYPRPPGPPE